MNEQVQETGVRRWAGDDLVALQQEPLQAIQKLFEEYGPCIVQGCTVEAAGNLYRVTPGIIALAGQDAKDRDTFKVVPFAGADSVPMPIYLTLTHTTAERVYGDGKVKPVAYSYVATATGVRPVSGPFLEITAAGGRRFVDAVGITQKLDKTGNGRDVTVTFSTAAARTDISSGEKLTSLWGKVARWLTDLKTVAFSGKAADLVQEAGSRLVTDTEKATWNDKFTRAEVTQKDTDTLATAKGYTDTQVSGLGNTVYPKSETYTRTETDSRDADTLAAARQYVIDRLAEIIGGSPAALNTLYEIAAALGNDPNFATTIMALLNGKADSVHTHTVGQVGDLQHLLDCKVTYNGRIMPEANPRTEIGYGYAENGWAYTGPAMSFGAGADYYAQIQTDFHNLYFRARYNNVFNAWRKLAFADETPGWAKQPDKPGYSAAEIAETADRIFLTHPERDKLAALPAPIRRISSFAEATAPGDYAIPANAPGGPEECQGNPEFWNVGLLRVREHGSRPEFMSDTETAVPSAGNYLLSRELICQGSGTAYYFISYTGYGIGPWQKIFPAVKPGEIQTGKADGFNDYTETGKYSVRPDTANGPGWSIPFPEIVLEVERTPSGAIWQTVKAAYIPTASTGGGTGATTPETLLIYTRCFFPGQLIGSDKWTQWHRIYPQEGTTSVIPTPTDTPSTVPSATPLPDPSDTPSTTPGGTTTTTTTTTTP